MDKRLAYWLMALLGLASIVGPVYVFYVIITVSNAISNQKDIIPFDTGDAYFLVISFLWPCIYIEFIGYLRGPDKAPEGAMKLMLIWLFVTILLANAITWYIEHQLTSNGYKRCQDPAEINRTVIGDSLLFKKYPCK